MYHKPNSIGIRKWHISVRRGITALVPLVLTGGLILCPHNKGTMPAKVTALARASGDRSTLTLTDGKTLVLDDSSYGELAREGFTQVLQQGEGTIYYRTAGAASAYAGYNTLTTPRAGQFNVVLPDGSRVWLNNASILRFPVSFNGSTREVEISGEAYFSIVEDLSRPFLIKVRHGAAPAYRMEIEALGTEIDVMAYGDEDNCRATLVKGQMKVRAAHRELTLPSGQQAAVSLEGKISLLRSVDVEQASAWKNGLFAFRDATLQEIMRQVARWYDVDVVFRDDIDKKFSGRIPRQVNISLAARTGSYGMGTFRAGRAYSDRATVMLVRFTPTAGAADP